MFRAKRLNFQTSTHEKLGPPSRAREMIDWRPCLPSRSVPLMPASRTTSQVAPALDGCRELSDLAGDRQLVAGLVFGRDSDVDDAVGAGRDLYHCHSP
jgi:hypothetical protein